MIKMCQCGRVIDVRSDQCQSCARKAAWRNGVYARMVARARRLRTRPGPYIVDYETMTEAGWPLLRPAPV